MSDIENPKLGFERSDPGEHSENISFWEKIWMKSRNYDLAYFSVRKIALFGVMTYIYKILM